MTVKDINKKFEEVDKKLKEIESVLNDTSIGVDFYNACKLYYSSESGSREQRTAVLNIFAAAFDFADGKIPAYFGGEYMAAGSWFIEIIKKDIADPQFIKELKIEAVELYRNDILTYEEAENYPYRCMAMLEAMSIANEINQIDEIFYDIGLINPITGEIDLTVYNNWEDVVKQYAEEHNLFEDGFDEFSAHISNIIGEAGDWFKELYDDLKYGKEITPHEPTRKITKDTVKKLHTARTTRYDPLILDLDGDGFNVEKKEFGANFDLDKNGFAEKINWTKKDGFLCLDLNGNGAIDDGGELFGDQTLLADGTKAKNGFEALAQYDSNGDGVIDANDEIFDSLRVWVDADGNGISGEGEMKTLAELGITSINLGYENVNAETGTEATIGNTATFTREDGTTSGIGELWVSSDLFDTVDRLDIEIPDEIAALPDVKSIGNVYSLRNAMALDETGELKELVESYISEEDADKRIAITEQILFFISGAKNIAANSRGSYIDARQLAVIEAMLGEKYVGTSGANPHSDAAPILKSAYQDLLNMYFNELNAQTFIKDYAALLRYTENGDGTKTLNADLVNCILEYQLENGDENAKKMLKEVARYVQYLDNGGINGINAFIMNYVAISTEYAAEIAKVMPNGYVSDGENPLDGTSNGDFLIGSNNNDVLYGNSGADTLIGGKGDDILYGGRDNDTYVFNLGDGNDIIEDYVPTSSNSKADKVIFGEGISADDIKVERSGNNMIVRYSENDSITLINQYSNEYYWVENFEFADGTKRTINDLLNVAQTIHGSGKIEDHTSGYGNKNNTLVGSDGADELYGYEGTDTLIGGKGDDILYGGRDNDTYVFNLGDGNDIIEDYVPTSSNSKADKVIFGEGISADDIKVERSGNNMIVRYSENDSITLINQYSNEYYWVENFEFADGTKRTINDLLNVAQTIHGSGKIEDHTSGYGNKNNTLVGSDGADELYGYEGTDTLIGGKGDDILYGGRDNDTYIFNLGDGNDIIEDYVLNTSNSKADKVIFGEDISAEDIVFSRQGNNLVISYGSGGDTVTVQNQYYSSYYEIERFETSDGYSISNTQVNLLIQSMATFEADTGMSWAEAAKQSTEEYTDIISQMWVKSVS